MDLYWRIQKYHENHSKKKTRFLQPGDALEHTAIKLEFEKVKFYTRLWSLSSLLLCEVDTVRSSNYMIVATQK
jgi:hypothetical protein